MPLLDELVHDFTMIMDVHEDQNVGQQMAIFYDLALFIARVGGNGSPIAEGGLSLIFFWNRDAYYAYF